MDISLLDADGNRLKDEHPLGKCIDAVAIPIKSVQGINVYPLDLALAEAGIVSAPAIPLSVIGYHLGLPLARVGLSGRQVILLLIQISTTKPDDPLS